MSQCRGGKPVECKKPASPFLLRKCSSKQVLQLGVSFLSASMVLRPWNIIHVSDFILIHIGTKQNVMFLFTFYKPLIRTDRKTGWQINVQNCLEPRIYCTQPKQHPACMIYSCEIQMELIQLICAYSYSHFRTKYF